MFDELPYGCAPCIRSRTEGFDALPCTLLSSVFSGKHLPIRPMRLGTVVPPCSPPHAGTRVRPPSACLPTLPLGHALHPPAAWLPQCSVNSTVCVVLLPLTSRGGTASEEWMRHWPGPTKSYGSLVSRSRLRVPACLHLTQCVVHLPNVCVCIVQVPHFPDCRLYDCRLRPTVYVTGVDGRRCFKGNVMLTGSRLTTATNYYSGVFTADR
jgi:hypothetical protein